MYAAIQDISLWRTLNKKEKIKLIETLCTEVLKGVFNFKGEMIGSDELGLLYHEPTSAEFVLIPGGSLLMGFAIDDIFGFWQSVDHAEMTAHQHTQTYEAARPVRQIAITPFLVSRGTNIEALEVHNKDNDWDSVAKTFGLDLLNDPEWEWCAREGGLLRFVGVPAKLKINVEDDFEFNEETGWGLRDMLDENQKLQGIFYDNLAQVPNSNLDWAVVSGASRVGRYVHTMWQSTGECITAHAANRYYPQDEDGLLRWVYRLPELIPQKSFNGLNGYENLVSALGSGKGKGLKSALYTLEELTVLKDGLVDLVAALPELLEIRIIGQKFGSEVLAKLARCLGPRELFEYDKNISSEFTPLDSSASEELLLKLIESNDTKISSAAISLASAFRPSKAIEQKLSDILMSERKNLELSISAAITLGVFAKSDSSIEIEKLLNEALKDKNAQLRGACACALAYWGGVQNLDTSTAEILIKTLSLPDKYANKIIFFSGSLSKGAISLLKKGPTAIRIKVAQHVLDQVRDIPAPKIAHVSLLLSLAFEVSPVPIASREVHSLNEFEKEVLLQISKHEIVDYFTLDQPIMAFYGIPENFIMRRLWLGLEESTYASNTVLTINWDGKDCHWPIWKHAEYLQINSTEGSKEYQTFSKSLNSLPSEVLVALCLEPTSILYRNDRWPVSYYSIVDKEKLEEAHKKIVKNSPDALMSIYFTALQHLDQLYAKGFSTNTSDQEFMGDLDKYLPNKILLSEKLQNLYFQMVTKDQMKIYTSLFKRLEPTVLKEKMYMVAQSWIRKEQDDFEELRSHGRAGDIAQAGVFLNDLDLMAMAMRLDGRSAWNSVSDVIEKASVKWSELKELREQLSAFRKKALPMVSSGKEMAQKVLSEFAVK